MGAVEYLDKKVEREQKIASLEAERASLQSEIAAMKEKFAQLEFERSARTLQSEIDALRTEKTSLEGRASAYESEMEDTDVNKPSLVANRAGPAVLGNAGQVPVGQGKVEQVRPLRDAVPERTSNPQRPSPVAGIPKTAGPVQPQGLRTKAINEKEAEHW
jgi:FtsZ-binding cell division protein ZapB